MKKYPDLKPKTVLAVAAHPDDLDFAAAGSLANFAKSGSAVYYLVVTDGSKGTTDKSLSAQKLIKIRRSEQQKAATAIGATDVIFLGYRDGELELTIKLKRDIVKVIRQLKPEVVITMDPGLLYIAERGFINHPDHRVVGLAVLDAVFPLARDHLTFPDHYQKGLKPHKTKTLLLINYVSGNYCIDISDTFETKIAALKAHASQTDSLSRLETWMRQMAESAGQESDCKFGERFVRIDLH